MVRAIAETGFDSGTFSRELKDKLRDANQAKKQNKIDNAKGALRVLIDETLLQNPGREKEVMETAMRVSEQLNYVTHETRIQLLMDLAIKLGQDRNEAIQARQESADLLDDHGTMPDHGSLHAHRFARP